MWESSVGVFALILWRRWYGRREPGWWQLDGTARSGWFPKLFCRLIKLDILDCEHIVIEWEEVCGVNEMQPVLPCPACTGTFVLLLALHFVEWNPSFTVPRFKVFFHLTLICSACRSIDASGDGQDTRAADLSRNCWKQCFLCGLCQGHIRAPQNGSEAIW
jgi:hypothetical protein